MTPSYPIEGDSVGETDGVQDGVLDGLDDGSEVGVRDVLGSRDNEGAEEGCLDGTDEGLIVGANVEQPGFVPTFQHSPNPNMLQTSPVPDPLL